MSELRLIYQANEHHPWGVYSGTTIRYCLQHRENETARWQTAPCLDYVDLSEADRAALNVDIEKLRNASPCSDP